MIDLVLEKIKLNKGKGLDKKLLRHILAETENYSEVRYIIDKLNLWNYKITLGMSDVILMFTEDYDDAKKIFNNFEKAKITKRTKMKQSLRYLRLMQIADTLEQVEEIILEMNNNKMEIGAACYFEIIKKQKDYKSARKIYEENIFFSDKERIENWKNRVNTGSLKQVYGILYLKANKENELDEIKNELKSVNMSTNLRDYYYLKEKSCKMIISKYKNSILCDKLHGSALINYINNKDDNHIQITNFEDNQKISKTYNVYKRNRELVEYIKKIYFNNCQICGETIDLGNKYYSEVHHIHPLYLNGPDILENMIVLCPNHHILFDKGAISINLDDNSVKYLNGREEHIKLLKHNICKNYTDFHNDHIINKKVKSFILECQSKVNYGSKVTLIKIDTKEEVVITICDEKRGLSYIEFKLLNSNVGDKIVIDNHTYFISKSM